MDDPNSSKKKQGKKKKHFQQYNELMFENSSYIDEDLDNIDNLKDKRPSKKLLKEKL